MRHRLFSAFPAALVHAISCLIAAPASAAVVSFGYTGAFVNYDVSTTGTYRIVAYGAQGGSTEFATGGLGAEIGGDVMLDAGQMLTIAVGGRGENGNANSSSGGGGGTFVVIGGVPLLIAGGGGGAGFSAAASANGQATTSGAAGQGGGALGSSGAPGGTGGNGGQANANVGAGGGGGGFLTDGGSNVVNLGGNGGASFADGLAGGAAGQTAGSAVGAGGFGGGGGGGADGPGGGGGYSGGGSGFVVGAGGGGSYDVDLTSPDSVLLSGIRGGNGLVTLELIAAAVSPTTGVPEPKTLALFVLGAVGLATTCRRRDRVS